jgi:uncharacterized protein DUF6519
MSGQFRGDFTRDTFAPFKRFSRVLMQQGRVQLDADWNEQASILLHYIRTLAKDLIGPSGASGNAFLLAAMKDTAGNALADFSIHRGDFYVDGVLCELDAESIPVVPGATGGNQVLLPSTQVGGTDLIPLPTATSLSLYICIFNPADPGSAPILVPIPFGFDGHTLSVPSLPPGASAIWLSLATTYLTQPDLPGASAADLQNGPYLAYLDVWERHISCVEDDSVLEVALGGPDTASRHKVVSQVKLANQQFIDGIPGQGTAADIKKWLNTAWPRFVSLKQPPNRGWLLAQTSPQPVPSTNPCVISPSAQYRGAENQLYRVEVHTGGSFDPAATEKVPTFKWSREDGSVVFKVLKVTVSSGSASPTTQIQLASLGRDTRLGLHVGDWVELVNNDYTLLNWAFPLLQVQSIVPATATVTLTGAVDSRLVPDATKPPKHPLLRRWDHKQLDPATTNVQLIPADNAIKIVESSGTPPAPWIDLEDGVQVQFQPAPGAPGTLNKYRTGDYWLIPARTAGGGEVEWPTDTKGNPVAQSPHGITHHYAPLAVVNSDASGKISTDPIDVRPVITPAAK